MIKSRIEKGRCLKSKWVLFLGLIVTAFFNFKSHAQCIDTLNLTSKHVSCAGRCDGKATATLSGESGPFAFFWSTNPMQVTPTAIGLCAGTYSVTVIDTKGCSQVKSILVDSVQLKATIGVTNITCHGSADGKMVANPIGGTAPYKFTWSTTPAKTTKTITGLSSGIFVVTITDKNGCTTSAIDSLINPPPITFSAVTTSAGCNTNNGSTTMTVAGGIQPFQFSWNSVPIQNSINLTNVPAGNYTLTVVDSFGCKMTNAVTIANATGFGLKVTKTNVLCYGALTGKSTATASGGTKPYTYLWSDGTKTAKLTNVAAGTYTVTATDHNGCSSIEVVEITSPKELSAKFTTTPISCNGQADGKLKVVVNGGKSPYLYSWSTTPPTTIDTAIGLSAGTYSVIVTDTNSCSMTFSTSLTQPNSLTVKILDSSVTCNGGLNGSLTAIVSGGITPYKYSWFNNSTNLTNKLNNLSVGIYSLSVADSNGCIVAVVDTIKQPALLTVNTLTNSAACNTANGSIASTTTGGVGPYQYSWNDGSSSSLITNLFAGVYNLTVTDANHCETTTIATVATTSGFVVKMHVDHVNVCSGDSLGALSVSVLGAVGTPTYVWSVRPTLNEPAISGLPAGSYDLVVNDANGCVQHANAVLVNPVKLTASFVKHNVICDGSNTGSDSIIVSGGIQPYSYNWSAIGAMNEPSINNLSTGVYSVSVTDANGCLITASNTITQPKFLYSTVNINPLCYGDSNAVGQIIMKTGTGPFMYVWPTYPVQNTNTVRGVYSGIYTVTVTDKNGCTYLVIDTIQQTSRLVPKAIGTIPCGDTLGNVTATITGGTQPYHYLWSTTDTSLLVSNLKSGSYSLSVTDKWGCTNTSTAIINKPTLLQVVFKSKQVSCYGDSDGVLTATAIGGKRPYSYLWDTGSNSDSIANLKAGIYHLNITDSSGCNFIAIDSVLRPPQISLSSNVTPNICGQSVGSVNIHASGGSGGYQYTWLNATPSNDSILTGLIENNYSVVVMDQNGCSSTGVALVSAQGKLGPILSNTVDQPCFNGKVGSISLSTPGSTVPIRYSWQNGDTLNQIKGLSVGSYSVTISDGIACTLDTFFLVSQPSQIRLSSNVVPNYCGQSNGSIQVHANGGAGGFTYNWLNSNVNTDSILTGLIEQTYSIIVTDRNGCTFSSSIEVTAQGALGSAVATINNEPCYGDKKGNISLVVPGTNIPLHYKWQTNDTISQISQLSEGTYSVTVSDGYACHLDTFFVIQQPTAIIGSSFVKFPDRCGKSNGTVTMSSMGGISPCVYSWTNGIVNSLDSNLAAGNYIVTITDANSCTNTITVSVPNWPPPTLSDVMSVPTCPMLSQGSLMVYASGVGLHYAWNTGDTTPHLLNLPVGSYTVTVSDKFNCITSSVAIVTPYNVSSPNLGGTQTIEKGTKVPFDVQGYVSYRWSPSIGISIDTIANPIVSPVLTTTYTLQVKDNNGCLLKDSVKIIVDDLFLPNAFSPNHDGENDVYYVKGIVDYINMEFLIYDRWGELVFSTNDPLIGWDGTRNGLSLESGVYICVLTANFKDGTSVLRKGNITLVR